MFCLKEPSTLKQSWRITATKEKDVVTIGQEILQDLRRQDILAIDFLYQSYRTKINGVILNEENEMNTRLQVSAFLGALSKSLSKQFLVIILTLDEFIAHWHYHLTKHGGLRVDVITPDTCPEDFFEETNMALILSFSNLKLAQCLAEYEFFSVILDSFDLVSQKMAIRKLVGEFNIGLTTRNFYIEPDQKIHWTMLNWSNPGVFGKLAHFYEIDNDNFANFRNSYKTWWFRLSWNFCESLKPYTQKEKCEYQSIIENWKTNLHGLTFVSSNEKRKSSKKVAKKVYEDHNIIIKKEKGSHSEKAIENESPAKEKVIYKTKGKKPIKKIQYGVETRETKVLKKPEIKEEDCDSSADTIIYEDNTNIQNPSISKDSFENLVLPDPSDLNPVEDMTHKLMPSKNERARQKSDPTSLEDDFFPFEPAKKRCRNNEKPKETTQQSQIILDTSVSKNKSKGQQNTKDLEHDDLIQSFLPNSQKNMSKEGECKVFGSLVESEASTNTYESEHFTLNGTNLDLDAKFDSDGEADSFLHSLVGKKIDFNTDVRLANVDCSKSTESVQKTKKGIDMKKLEDLLKETENY